MILEGNQRAGAKDLALHLLKEENEHVEVYELRGFVSDNLVSALNEAYAISKGTKAKQFLFSLSLNPPLDQKAPTEAFVDAVDQVEEKLGLSDQPRAIVFHEKKGRRHAHAVWSRTNAQQMKAIQLSHTKLKLADISRNLYLQHDWKMPRGFMQSQERDLRNFSMAQWQQAKRTGKDPREIKAVLQECWAASDTQATFQQALKERGYTLARGDRRGFVALDHRCEVFSISKKWIGKPVKDVRARLSDPESLPSVDKARDQIAMTVQHRLKVLHNQQATAILTRVADIDRKRELLVKSQRIQRQELERAHQQRAENEARMRQARFNQGLRGLVDHFTGKRRRIREQNERETLLAYQRDRNEKDALVFADLEQRRVLQGRIERLEALQTERSRTLTYEVGQYREIQQGTRETVDLMSLPIRKKSPGMEPEI